MEVSLGTRQTSYRITMALFAVYVIALMWILLFKMGVRFSYMGNRVLNLIPFREYVLYDSKIDRAGTILNILIFIPLGIYIAILKTNWNVATKILTCLLFSFAIESLQYILAIGAFDITDVITNTTGGIAGLVIYFLLIKMMNSHQKAHKLINILAVAGTLFMIVLLLMLKMNLLPVRYQ
jgi:glycopeptide antibiotics resistance protein